MKTHRREFLGRSVRALTACSHALLVLQGCGGQQPAPPPLGPTPYGLEEAFPGLDFKMPIAAVRLPDDSNRLAVVERAGRVQMLEGLSGGQPAKKLFLDISHPRDGTLTTEGECGLLGLAFHPQFQSNGRCYVYYSLRIGGRLHQRLSQLPLKTGETVAKAETEQPLFTQEDPASNHNGGDLHFGPDGYLYISVGDGGAGNDKFDNARFIDKGFFAAILRIDVDKRDGNPAPNDHPAVSRDEKGQAFYAVPKDNPFIGAASHHGRNVDPQTVRTEIYATGLRNPWRFSFDPNSGRLFAGDVGQNLYEEIDLIVKGGDYGWSYREAAHPFKEGPGGGIEPPEFKPVPPIFEYPRTLGLSVTGGVVYHGTKFSGLTRRYIFADYAFGRIVALREGQSRWKAEILANEPGIVALATDPRDGEVLFVNLALGKLKRLKKL